MIEASAAASRDGQVGDVGVEVALGRGRRAVGAVAEVGRVQVEVEDASPWPRAGCRSCLVRSRSKRVASTASLSLRCTVLLVVQVDGPDVLLGDGGARPARPCPRCSRRSRPGPCPRDRRPCGSRTCGPRWRSPRPCRSVRHLLLGHGHADVELAEGGDLTLPAASYTVLGWAALGGRALGKVPGRLTYSSMPKAAVAATPEQQGHDPADGDHAWPAARSRCAAAGRARRAAAAGRGCRGSREPRVGAVRGARGRPRRPGPGRAG